MPILKNQRHELFCQEIAKGATLDKAYVTAGYAPGSARANAATLKHRKGIKERIAELQERLIVKEEQSVERAITKLSITKEAVLGELAKLAFANMADYMKVGEDGQPTLNFNDLTRDQAAALVEITVEEFKDGRSDKREVRRVKFKLADKQKSLEALGKHLGLFIERHEVGAPGDFARMTDEELNEALREQAASLGLPDDAVGKLLELKAERLKEE